MHHPDHIDHALALEAERLERKQKRNELKEEADALALEAKRFERNREWKKHWGFREISKPFPLEPLHELKLQGSEVRESLHELKLQGSEVRDVRDPGSTTGVSSSGARRC